MPGFSSMSKKKHSMTKQIDRMTQLSTEYSNNIYVLKTGYSSSIILTLITLITFAFAMMAVPPSGPYCPGDCMQYPYADSLKYYPRDYFWIYSAILQLITYIIFMISIHFLAPEEKKIFSFIGIAFTIVAAVVLLSAYFIQFAVVPISLLKGETEGIALFTQYNGHGIFIALEELGYMMISLSLLFLSPVFLKKSRLEKAIRWIFILPFMLTIISLISYTIKFSIDRSYRFEVAAISANWLGIISISILMAIFFRRLIKCRRYNSSDAVR